MKLFILTDEPDHSSSKILGVYRSWDEGMEALRASVKPTQVGRDGGTMLTEWDLEANRKGKQWLMVGFLTRKPDSGAPVRIWKCVTWGPTGGFACVQCEGAIVRDAVAGHVCRRCDPS